MRTDDENKEWRLLWDGVREIQRWFPEGMILIGGLAVWMHAKQSMDERLVDLSHDADFYLSLADYADLRDIEEITNNRRLGKHQMIKHGIDYDIYVENQNDLIVPYSEALRKSEVIEGFRCASLEHLLALKVKAFADRKTSSKGRKDARDVARILMVFADEKRPEPSSDALGYLSDDGIHQIKELIAGNNVFMEMSQGNAHEAKQLKRRAERGWARIEAALECSPPHPEKSGSRHSRGPGFGC